MEENKLLKPKNERPQWKTGTWIMALGLLMTVTGIVTDPTILIFGLGVMGVGAILRIRA